MANAQPVMLPVGTMRGDCGQLCLTTKDARVTIRRELRQDVAVLANRPEHWTVGPSGDVNQVRVATEGIHISIGGGGCGITIGGDLIGHNGGSIFSRLRQMVTGGSSTCIVSMDDTEVVLIDGGTEVRIPTYGLPTNVVNNEVWVGGEKVYPKPEGTVEKPLAADAPPRVTGPDLLEIVLPEAFQGTLAVTAGDGAVVIDGSWQGGDVTLHALGDGDITCGHITALRKCLLTSDGDGKMTVGDLSADIIDIKNTDDGDFCAGAISGRLFSTNMTGDGKVTLKQAVSVKGACRVSVLDDGDFTANGITAESISFDVAADGNLTPGAVVATGKVTLELTDDGSYKGTQLKAGSFTTTQTADGALELANLEVSGPVVVKLTDDGGITISELLTCGSLTVNNSGDAPVDIPAAVQSSGPVTFVSDDDGAIELGAVRCTVFSDKHSADGGLHAESVHCDTLTIVNNDDATITIDGGAAKNGTVTNSGDANVRLKGDFSTLTQRNTGDGKIRIK